MKQLIVTTYLAYLPVAIFLTFFVARIFFKNSKIFMLDIFNGRQDIAISTNKLFEVGFYLLNLGFALFFMKINDYNFIDGISNTLNFTNRPLRKIILNKDLGYT